MFAIRIHSVDTEHPLFFSLPSNSNPNPNLNPKFVEQRGIIHLFRSLSRRPSTSDSSTSNFKSTLLFIVAIPNYFSSDDLLRFFGSCVADISEFLIIRNYGVEDRYSVVIRTWNQVSANALYRSFNGKRFSPPEVEICHILFALSVEFTEVGEIASTSPSGYVELPTCPICLERLDQDTSGIQSTLCDHSFDCSCISKWTYLSCQICRLCQQPDDRPNCSVCDASENLWACIICGFVGCGRYKEGHTLRHWKDTQHCYSLNLETQRVWDYEGDSFVHRLNHSKSDGKSVVADPHSMSYKKRVKEIEERKLRIAMATRKQASTGSGCSSTKRRGRPLVMCTCGKEAVVWTVENGGSRFYSCPLWPNTQCDMFQWIDANNPYIEDLQFRILEKDTIIGEMEINDQVKDEGMKKLQRKYEIVEELYEMKRELWEMRIELMKSTRNENLLIALVICSIFFAIVY